MDNQTETLIHDNIECDEMIKLLEDFYDINQIQRSLSMIIVKQRQKVNTIQNTMSDSTLSIENGFEDLKIEYGINLIGRLYFFNQSSLVSPYKDIIIS